MFTIIGIAVVIALIVAVVVVLIRPDKGASLSLEIPVASLDDDMVTIRIITADKDLAAPVVDGARQKQLPGYFEITGGLSGAMGKKLFITGSYTKIGREEAGKDKSRGWITFPSTTKTISRHQADLVYERGGYSLANVSGVNPTMVNGKAMKDNETLRLKDGDRIAFSEVEVTYRSTGGGGRQGKV
ncbi:MAG: FHA domain-containing protein [Nitrospirae bacterium]|nr:FHA domain-containing protein [Nitrospirota bacterium]